LMEGVLRMMLLTKLKLGAIWLVMGLMAFGAGLFIYQGATAQSGNVENAKADGPQSLPKEPMKHEGQAVADAKKDSDALQGKKRLPQKATQEKLEKTWRLLSSTHAGMVVPGDLVEQVQVKFVGDRMRFTPALEFVETQIEGQNEKRGQFRIGE